MSAFMNTVDLAAGVTTGLYSSVSGTDTTGNIRIVNRNPYTITVSVAFVFAPDVPTAIANLTDADYIEFDAPVSAKDVLENSGIAIPPGYVVLVNSSNDLVNAVIYGYIQAS